MVEIWPDLAKEILNKLEVLNAHFKPDGEIHYPKIKMHWEDVVTGVFRYNYAEKTWVFHIKNDWA